MYTSNIVVLPLMVILPKSSKEVKLGINERHVVVVLISVTNLNDFYSKDKINSTLIIQLGINNLNLQH